MVREKKIQENQNNISDEWKIYLYMLKCAIYGTHLESEKIAGFQKVTVKQLADRANRNSQRVLLSRYLLEYAQLVGEDWEEPAGYKTFTVLKEYEKYRCLRDIITLSKKEGLHFVIFKGCILADLYPQYAERISCDSDIYIDKEEKEQALKLLYTYGYEKNEEHSKEEVTVLVHKERFHTIELHTCLWEDYIGKRLSILDSFELTREDKRITLEACGFEVTTLGYQEHLIYQLFHIIKHFSLQGVGMKYLADITLYVNAYGKYLDYDDFWNKLEQLGYTKFCYYLFVICVEYLGMDDTILSGREMTMGDELYGFMQDLLQVGNPSDGNQVSWQIFGTLTPYFTGEKKTSTSKWKRRLEVLFPRAEDLRDDFAYAREHKILLPIAWVHKILMYFIKYQKHKDEWYNASEKLNAAEYRIGLMNDMGLIEEE